jgi:hypothetical protein
MMSLKRILSRNLKLIYKRRFKVGISDQWRVCLIFCLDGAILPPIFF